MSPLKSKIENALNEDRTLMLGGWFGYMSWRLARMRALQRAPHGVDTGFDNIQSR